jgi:hypothetical protein
MSVLKQTILILSISLLTSLNAYADSWSCRHGNDVREVHIERLTPSPAPCEVVYKKLTEGVEDQVLWSAQSDGAYCGEKASGFITKLESFGWTCVETIRDDAATQ